MRKFLKASLSFYKLEFKAIKFYPSNFVLAIIKSFVGVGIWFFVSLFLKDYAKSSLTEYGGDFVAYMVIGVMFFQNAASILNLPYQSINMAFWDKRLEVYNSSPYGIWAFITGKFMWSFLYNFIVVVIMMIIAVLWLGVNLNDNIHVVPALLYYLVFIFTCFGIGLIGASTFFTLEVKQGREPVTWLTNVLVRIFSGVYFPLAVLPESLRYVSYILPHTYALKGIRLIMISGLGFENAIVLNNFLVVLLFCVVSMFAGIKLFNKAIIKAEQTNGVGMVV